MIKVLNGNLGNLRSTIFPVANYAKVVNNPG